MGCIYVIQNALNGKQYVGQTIKTAEARLIQHFREAKYSKPGSRYLNHAIRKYGDDNFKVSVLEDNIDDNDILDNLERKFIQELNTLAPNGYNIQTGGQAKGRTHCESSRELMRQMKLGDKNHNFGKPRTEEAKRNISLAKAGEKHHFYGKTFSDDHKINLSVAHKKYEHDLPMYIGYVKAREGKNHAGYLVINPTTKKKTYFTSMKFTMEEKLAKAKALLDNILNVHSSGPVQRLDGGGSPIV
jgi:group I intron endonuclease